MGVGCLASCGWRRAPKGWSRLIGDKVREPLFRGAVNPACERVAGRNVEVFTILWIACVAQLTLVSRRRHWPGARLPILLPLLPRHPGNVARRRSIGR